MTMRAHVGILACVLASACFAADKSEGDYGYMDDDLPSGERCDTDGGSGAATDGCETGSTTGPPPDGGVGSACERSDQCNEGLVCSAPFDGERGVFACVIDCIEEMDEARWCADASACCDPNAVCTSRGYCVGEGATTDTTSGSTSSSDTSGGSSSGSTDATGATGGSGSTDTGTTG